MKRRGRHETSNCRSKVEQKIRGWWLSGGQKLTRHGERRSIEMFSAGHIVNIAEAEQNPGKTPKPLIRGQTGTEAVLQAAVKTLHKTVDLRMISCGHHMLNTQQQTEQTTRSQRTEGHGRK